MPSNFVDFARKFTLLQLAESLCPGYDYKIFEVKADWLKRLADSESSAEFLTIKTSLSLYTSTQT